jgi:hypothetical protein
MFPLVVELGKNMKKETVLKVSVALIKVSVFFLVIECGGRHIYSTLVRGTGGSFYKYKFYSFMFFDTNFAGLMILVLYFFCKYLEIYYNIKLSAYKKVLFVLCFLTWSRAAILSLLLSLLLFYNIKKNSKFWRIVFSRIMLTLCAVGIVVYYFYSILYESDGSLRTKFKLFEQFANLLNSNTAYNVLTGYGMGKSSLYLGIYPHNFFLLYLLDIGIIGLSIEILYLLYITTKLRMKGFFVVIPYLIAAQSATATSVHYLYVVLGLMFLLQRHKTYIIGPFS